MGGMVLWTQATARATVHRQHGRLSPPLENLPLVQLSEGPVLETGWTPHGCANAIMASVALLVAFLSAFITCRATYWPPVRPAARRLIRRAQRRREDEAGPEPAPGGRLYPTFGPLMEESSGSAN